MSKSIEIEETRLLVYNRDGFKCQFPGCKVIGYVNLQMAHCIRQGQEKFLIQYYRDNFNETINKKQAKAILNSSENLITSCSNHNSFFDITFRPEDVKNKINQIRGNK